jgi:hypothetical protein
MTLTSGYPGDRLSFDARRLLHHPGQCPKGEEGVGAAATADAHIPTVPSQEASEPKPKPTFQPRVFSGYIFGLTAAICYGSSPLMARQAFLHAPGASCDHRRALVAQHPSHVAEF